MTVRFGTDGVRGVANAEITPELALAIGRAGAAVLAPGGGARIVVGRDTRLSGTMIDAAVCSGIASTGCEAVRVGVVPTPAVARVAKDSGAAAGVVVSASHNPVPDNGIKFFGADGFKLADAVEREIEAMLARDAAPRATGTAVGIVRDEPELSTLYVDAAIALGSSLRGLTIVVDAAFGAAYSIGPYVFAALGATVEPLHASDDGSRINVACGSTDLAPLAKRVLELGGGAVGVAFDGDADRALFVDETGAAVDGDKTMLVLAREKKRRGSLARDRVVGTVMSNIGLERALARDGIGLERAAVGDRYVLEAMRAGGYSFGGEQSGHVIDFAAGTTGDGIATAVALFSLVASSGRTLRDLTADLEVAPQVLINVRAARSTLEDERVRDAVRRVERALGTSGRILVRASGTEPLVRVMVEGDDAERIERYARDVADAVEAIR